jgi:hypothetical protein
LGKLSLVLGQEVAATNVQFRVRQIDEKVKARVWKSVDFRSEQEELTVPVWDLI